MRLIIQRCHSGSVTVGSEVVGKIGAGVVCLVGIGQADTKNDAEWICDKILHGKYWKDPKTGKWAQNVMQRNGSILLVSQFTLHGYLKGNKPDFHLSMAPTEAEVSFVTIYNISTALFTATIFLGDV
jgi:D-tyrosyl-tRNA(Tyr) deacylase